VRPLLIDFTTILGLNIDIDSEQFLKLYWFGYGPMGANVMIKCFATSLIFDGFRFALFKNRQRRHLPSSLQLQLEIVTLIKWICRNNKKIS
jgi:hypothetical protein